MVQPANRFLAHAAKKKKKGYMAPLKKGKKGKGRGDEPWDDEQLARDIAAAIAMSRAEAGLNNPDPV